MTDTISLLLPTRGRRETFTRFVESAFATAARPDLLEVVARIDEDDYETYEALDFALPVDVEDYPQMGVFYTVGPRQVLSQCWNDCYYTCTGEIVGQMGDDIVFRTPGWDDTVRDAFDRYPDKIVFVHGDDGGHPETRTFGTHGFVHYRWVLALGYFVPPYFSSDWNDTWLNEIANAVGRNVFVDILTEHMHPVHGKGPRDATYTEMRERGERDGVAELYERLAPQRAKDINRLQLEIDRARFSYDTERALVRYARRRHYPRMRTITPSKDYL